MNALREGDRISNYLLERRVGAGSFGEVWRARHHIFPEVVAIKVPTDPQYVRNLQREGVTIHGLRHPNIVRAIDLDPYADPPYLVMELVDGPSLREVIDELGAAFPIPAVVSIMRGVLQALAVAHEHDVIHRDVKPANILLHQPPDDLATISPDAVKVTDFGLGRVGGTTTQSMMQSGSMVTEEGRSIAGTLAYMSPEQKDGRPVDARSDLYACGLVLCEMLTGKRPTGGDVPSSVRSDVPDYLDEVFRRCYTRWDRRFASATEMLAALTPTATPVPPPMPAGPATPVGSATSVMPPPPPQSAPATRGATGEDSCSSCGAGVDGDDQFCIHCGAQLVARVPQCSACHGYVHRNDRFCIFCGNDLRMLTH